MSAKEGDIVYIRFVLEPASESSDRLVYTPCTELGFPLRADRKKPLPQQALTTPLLPLSIENIAPVYVLTKSQAAAELLNYKGDCL